MIDLLPVGVCIIDDEKSEALVLVDAPDAAGRVLGLLDLGAHHLAEA